MALIGLLVSAFLLSYAVPQRSSRSALELELWRAAHPSFCRLADALDLDRIYTTPWFACLLGAFLLTVCFSLIQQCRAAWQRTFREPAAMGDWMPVAPGTAQAEAFLRGLGFRILARSQGSARFVRHPWGYWGNVALHAGFVLALGSALTVLLTQQLAILHLEEGETVGAPAPWFRAESGLLARPFELPGNVTLAQLTREFWETGDLRDLRSRLEFTGRGGARKELLVGINEARWLGSTRVYQDGQSGHNFYLLFQGPDGRATPEALSFQLPPRPNVASYNDFRLPSMPYLLRGKYFADAARRAMDSGNPQLFLRLYEGPALLGELSLTQGTSGTLGPYRVSLVRTARWAGITFFDATGMAGLFFAFALIVCGGLLDYCAVPREVCLRYDGTGASMQWSAARFPEFYSEERDRIAAAFGAR